MGRDSDRIVREREKGARGRLVHGPTYVIGSTVRWGELAADREEIFPSHWVCEGEIRRGTYGMCKWMS